VRSIGAALVLVTLVLAAGADDRSAKPRVDAIVPVPPTEHQRLHWFGRRRQHGVPGTVTINRPGYVCDLDGTAFRDEDELVAHVRTVHRTPEAGIADRLLVRDGRVHFVAE
jgi:hypothetical protein